MPVYAIGDRYPEFEDEASNWIAPDATVIGTVRIGKDAGIWFGAVIRGDNEQITVGARTNIQEHCVFHTDPGFPLTVGAGCTVGHHAMLHGCTIGDNCLIGMGATVMNGVRIGRNCMVGAGALVTEGKVFEDNSLIVGAPARAIRTLDAEGVARLARSADTYANNARRFLTELKRLR